MLISNVNSQINIYAVRYAPKSYLIKFTDCVIQISYCVVLIPDMTSLHHLNTTITSTSPRRTHIACDCVVRCFAQRECIEFRKGKYDNSLKIIQLKFDLQLVSNLFSAKTEY